MKPLILAFAFCCLASWLSYGPRRHSLDTPGALALLAAGCGYCWGLAIRDRSPEGVMALSVMYDGLVLMAYYAMPMLVLGVRPTWYTVAGLCLVVAGMLLVRFGEQ